MNKYFPPTSRLLSNYVNGTTILYKNLHLLCLSQNKQITLNFERVLYNNPNNILKFIAKDKEEMLDFICGNTWPEFMEEFIQSIVQDLTCLN